MALTQLQFKVASTVSDGDTVTLDSPVTAGNLIAVTYVHSYSSCPSSVTNSEASTIATKIDEVVTGKRVKVCTMVAAASGSYTITAHMSCGIFRKLFIEELSGHDPTNPIDVTEYDVGDSISTTSISFGPINAVAGAGLRLLVQGDITSYTPTSGWTSPLDNNAAGLLQGKLAPSDAAYSLTIPVSNPGSALMTGILFSINPASGPPPSSNSLLAFQEMPSTAAATLNETSVKREVRLWDDLGQPKTGVVAADVTCRYRTNGGALASRSVVAGTIGTYLANSLVEIDATYAPGAYQWCPANTDVDAIGDQIFTFKGTDIFGELVLSVSGTDVFAAASSLDEMGDKFLDVSAGVTIINDGTQAVLPYSTGNVTKTLERAERSTTIEGMS